MTHFTDIELQRWRTGGPGNDRSRIADHVGECGACAARYAEAIRTRPILEADATADTREFVAAAQHVVASQPAAGARRLRWIVPLAAAAALVGALAVPTLVQRYSVDSTPRLRGAGIRALTPEGDLDANASLAWSSGVAADRYQVEIGDDSGVIYPYETSSSPLPLPAAIANAPAGRRYWWTVTALDRQGQPVTSSARRTFSIKPH